MDSIIFDNVCHLLNNFTSIFTLISSSPSPPLIMLYFIDSFNQEDCHHLKQDLRTLEKWVTQWKMSFTFKSVNFYKSQTN